MVSQLTQQQGFCQGGLSGPTAQDLEYAHTRAGRQAEESLITNQLDGLPPVLAADDGGQFPISQLPHDSWTIGNAIDDCLRE